VSVLSPLLFADMPLMSLSKALVHSQIFSEVGVIHLIVSYQIINSRTRGVYMICCFHKSTKFRWLYEANRTEDDIKLKRNKK
jgi:hypothetical protein